MLDIVSQILSKLSEPNEFKKIDVDINENTQKKINTGDIVIAAITSCTNTSNPSVMIGAGLVAKKAVEIFEQNNITFETSSDSIFIKLDKAQWIRVMTNLIKNSIQAIPHDREPDILVKISENWNPWKSLAAHLLWDHYRKIKKKDLND